MHPGTDSPKAQLRREMHRRLAELVANNSKYDLESHQIIENLFQLPNWKKAKHILLFAPFQSEPDLDLIWKEHSGELEGKRFYYPIIGKDKSLSIAGVDSLSDVSNASPHFPKVREPLPKQSEALHRLDLALIPGLAFTKSCQRLGRGSGAYDRLLADSSFTAYTIGICFECQIVDHLPAEEHDQKVNTLVSSTPHL